MKHRICIHDIAEYSKGQQINSDDLIDNGDYDYLNGGINPSGKWSDYNVKGRTITISEGGNSCGYINFMNSSFWCGAHCYYLYNVKGNAKYLYYALKSQQNKLMNIRSGACMPNIKKSDLGKFEFWFDTDTNEQVKVKGILENVENIIQLRKNQLDSFEQLIKARFIEMFGDPVINPMQWDKVKLNTCLRNIENGKSFICDGIPRIEENPAILKLSAVTNGIYNPEENKAIIDKNDFVESAEVHKGDLLFTRKNTPELVGMAAYVSSTPGKLMMPDLIFRLNTNLKCNKVYLWKLINHDLFRKQIQNIASGSAKSMSNISKVRLENLSICLPPIKQQNQFADFVQQVDKSKVVVQKALDETQLLFDSLMQKYFG